MSEKDFQAQVIQYAKLCGWLIYHTHDSRRSNPGFPDLVCVRPARRDRPGRVIYAELKSDRGKLTEAQSGWLQCLADAGAEAYCWRPADWQTIEVVLR